MTLDPRAFGLVARHDGELSRIARGLAEMARTLELLRRTAAPPIAEDSLAVERWRRNGFAEGRRA